MCGDRLHIDFCYASSNEHNVFNWLIERNDTLKKSYFKFFAIILTTLLLFFFYNSVENVQLAGETERFQVLSDAIKHSAVQCYAIEGFYPPSIEYLEQNYGLVVDHDKYVVSYSIFASNIMPDVEVYFK